MAIDWDDLPLTPWEQEVIARMENELGRRRCGMPGRVGEGPGPLLFVGAAVTVVGTVLAFGVPTHTPLAISGYILLLMVHGQWPALHADRCRRFRRGIIAGWSLGCSLELGSKPINS